MSKTKKLSISHDLGKINITCVSLHRRLYSYAARQRRSDGNVHVALKTARYFKEIQKMQSIDRFLR